MKVIAIKYLGPSEGVILEPFGIHQKDEIKFYPEKYGEALLGEYKSHRFEKVGSKDQDSKRSNKKGGANNGNI